MKLVNLNNTFTAFGSFAVFDDDYMPLYEKEFPGCKLYTDNDPSQANPSHKMLRIMDAARHLTVLLRPGRIDIQVAGHERSKKQEVINQAVDAFNKLDAILECPLAYRIAYVCNDFAFDDYGDLASAIAKSSNLLPESDEACDVAIRINTQKAIQKEVFNVVQSINNIMISRSNDPNAGQRRALMVAYDINTLVNNEELRFKLNDLVDYFDALYDEAASRLQRIDNQLTNKTM